MSEKILFNHDALGTVQEVSTGTPLPVSTWFGGKEVTKTVAFDGNAGSGAQGTVALFTVTGTVAYRLVAYCTEDLAGATATIAVGTTGNTVGAIASTTATNIDAGEIWYNATPVVGIATYNETNFPVQIIVNGLDIFATVGTAAITDGTITFKLFYNAISSDGSVVAA